MLETQRAQAPQHLYAFFLGTRAIIDFPYPMTMEVDESGHAPMLRHMRAGSDLSQLFEQHRALVCVGSGGVGKTTVAAALALAAAHSGRRTLCLTIDPARRLATSLGLSSFPREELQIGEEFLAQHHIQLRAPLTVMMLDAQATFDSLIRGFSRSEADARRILEHRVYRQLAQNLAGTQAYMAMEKVLSVLNDKRYDFVVLDTPPSARALDFFDAPKRMAGILDSPATRALSGALSGGKKLQLGLLASGLRRAMKGLETLTGTTLITDVADLVTAMNGLFVGFGERASEVDGRLRSGEFGYVLVTAPTARTIGDARRLARQMRSRSLPVGAVAFNRFAAQGLADASLADVELPPLGSTSGVSEAGLSHLVELARTQAESRSHQEQLCRPLLSELGQTAASSIIPAFAEDVHQPERLMLVARLLAPSAVEGSLSRAALL